MKGYNRSHTDMDGASAFFPQTFLNGPRRGMRGASPMDTAMYYTHDASDEFPMDPAFSGGLGGLHGLGDVPAPFSSPVDLAQDFGTDPGNSYFTDISFNGGAVDPAAGGDVQVQTSGGGFWSSLIDKAPSVIKDLMNASSADDYARKLNDVNLQRAAKGLAPINPQAGNTAAVARPAQAPLLSGMSPLVVGLLGSAAIGALFKSLSSRRSRRR